MHPTLSVNNISHTSAGSTNGVSVTHAGEGVEKRLYLLFGINHELNVVTGGKTHKPVTMLVSDVTYFTNILNGNKTSCTATNGVDLITGLGFVHQNAWLNNFVPQPFALVCLDYWWKKLLVMWWTKI
jgi:hypothetical protein